MIVSKALRAFYSRSRQKFFVKKLLHSATVAVRQHLSYIVFANGINPMPPDSQQVLFYPVDDTFKSSSLSLPVLLICIPVVSFAAIWGTVFLIAGGAIVGIERLTGRKKYTKKILSFLKKF